MQVLGILLVVAVMLFFGALAGAAIGAVVGWIVGLVFTDTMGLFAKMLGIPEAAPWQLGMIFGFLSAFVKSSVSTSSK